VIGNSRFFVNGTKVGWREILKSETSLSFAFIRMVFEFILKIHDDKTERESKRIKAVGIKIA
jgi:hypothetical protein